MRETRVRSLGWEDHLEKEMAIHSSTIDWKIPRTEEPGRRQSMGSQRVRHDWMTFTSLYFTMRTRDKETKTGNTVTRWSKSLEQRWGGPELGDGIEQGWRLLETCLTHCAVLSHSVMSDSLTPWTAAHQPPLFMGFFRQEYWNGLSCPPPGDLPQTVIETLSPVSSAMQAESLPIKPASHRSPLSSV